MLMCRKSTESGHRPVRRRKRPKEAPLPASPLLKKYIPVASPAANEHGVPPPISVPAVETCIAKGGGMPSGRIIMQGEEEPATGRSGQQGLGEQGAWGSRTTHLAMAQVLFFLVVIPPVRLLVGLGPPQESDDGAEIRFP